MRVSIYAFGKWRVYNNKDWNRRVLLDALWTIHGKTILSIFIAY